MGHVERQMHGGVPKDDAQHHLLVSLFDSKSGQRITDATLGARVALEGSGSQQKILEPMKFAGNVTYGNYFRMTATGSYRIEIEIQRSGSKLPVKTSFEYFPPRR